MLLFFFYVLLFCSIIISTHGLDTMLTSPPAITESIASDEQQQQQQQQQLDPVIADTNNKGQQLPMSSTALSRQLQTIEFMGAAEGVSQYPASPEWTAYTMSLTTDVSGYKEFKTQSAGNYAIRSFYSVVVNPPGPGYLLTATFVGTFDTESRYDWANLYTCDMTGTAAGAYRSTTASAPTSLCSVGAAGWSGTTLPVDNWSGKYGTAMSAMLFSDSSSVRSGFTVRFTYSICPADSYCFAGSTTPTACPTGTTSLAGSTTLGECILITQTITQTTSPTPLTTVLITQTITQTTSPTPLTTGTNTVTPSPSPSQSPSSSSTPPSTISLGGSPSETSSAVPTITQPTITPTPSPTDSVSSLTSTTTVSFSPSPSPSVSQGLGSGCVGPSCQSSSLSSNAAPSGLSPGGTAGIAIGCILVLLLIFGMIVRHFFMYQRKKPITGVAHSMPQQDGKWALSSMNPIQLTPVGNRALSSMNPLEPAPVTVVTVETVPLQPNNNLWKLDKDETDIWYVNTVTNETVWDLPQGAIMVE